VPLGAVLAVARAVARVQRVEQRLVVADGHHEDASSNAASSSTDTAVAPPPLQPTPPQRHFHQRCLSSPGVRVGYRRTSDSELELTRLDSSHLLTRLGRETDHKKLYIYIYIYLFIYIYI
jgi:hypothetical protein